VPTVLRSGPHRVFFYSADAPEPLHVHVEGEEAEAKFWLDPVCREPGQGFARAEIVRLARLVEENRELLLNSWYEYFGH
jgi:hypothetical protein